MKSTAIVIFTFLFSSMLGADVVKLRVNNDLYRIVLTGQEAQSLIASVGNQSFSSPTSTLTSVSCLDPIGRCEISIQSPNLRILARSDSERLLTAQLDDSTVAERLYNLMPGPEVDFNLRLFAVEFRSKTKTLDLTRNEFFMSCQKIHRSSAEPNLSYSCLVNAIVPIAEN